MRTQYVRSIRVTKGKKGRLYQYINQAEKCCLEETRCVGGSLRMETVISICMAFGKGNGTWQLVLVKDIQSYQIKPQNHCCLVSHHSLDCAPKKSPIQYSQATLITNLKTKAQSKHFVQPLVYATISTMLNTIHPG